MERTVLVTGASSGIGLATTLHLARIGFASVGSVRNEAGAEVLAKAAAESGVEVRSVQLDLTDDDRCRSVVEELRPWAIVNNAGFMNVGAVADVDPAEALHQLDVMVVGPMRLAIHALPVMRARGEGRILNVSSVAALATGALTGWYQAAKHALSAVTDALRREVSGWGVEVVLVEPGGFETGIWDRAKADLQRRGARSAYRSTYERALQMLELARPVMGDPRDVAELMGEILTTGRPRPRYRIGNDAPLLVAASRVLPEAARDRLIRAALKL